MTTLLKEIFFSQQLIRLLTFNCVVIIFHLNDLHSIVILIFSKFELVIYIYWSIQFLLIMKRADRYQILCQTKVMFFVFLKRNVFVSNVARFLGPSGMASAANANQRGARTTARRSIVLPSILPCLPALRLSYADDVTCS